MVESLKTNELIVEKKESKAENKEIKKNESLSKKMELSSLKKNLEVLEIEQREKKVLLYVGKRLYGVDNIDRDSDDTFNNEDSIKSVFLNFTPISDVEVNVKGSTMDKTLLTEYKIEDLGYGKSTETYKPSNSIVGILNFNKSLLKEAVNNPDVLDGIEKSLIKINSNINNYKKLISNYEN